MEEAPPGDNPKGLRRAPGRACLIGVFFAHLALTWNFCASGVGPCAPKDILFRHQIKSTTQLRTRRLKDVTGELRA